MKKLVTVIIPVHNRHEYFVKCLESVFSQDISHLNIEIIIVDEASQPPISKILKEKFSSKRKYISLIRNKRALGPSLARTMGLNKAKGEYIAFLDSDDFWRNDFLKICLSKIDSAKSEIVSTLTFPVFPSDFPVSQKAYFTVLSLVRILIFCLSFVLNSSRLSYSLLYFLRLSCMVFTKKAIGNAKFVMTYRTAEDWKFFWDCIRKNSPIIKIIPKIGVDVSYHGQSETIRRSNYWGYYYKLINELPAELRSSFGIKFFKLYTDFSVWKNRS